MMRSRISLGFKPVRRIVAVGDIHGDIRQAHTILRACGLVDKAMAWQASSKEHHDGMPTKMIQCGDLVHRGQEDVEVMDLFMRLRNEGGKKDVVCLLGNHEEMMAWGSIRYAEAAHQQYFAAANMKVSRPTQGDLQDAMIKLMDPGAKYGQFLRSLPLAHLDGRTIFNHAGLDPQWLQLNKSRTTPSERVEELNARAVWEWNKDPRSIRGTERVLADPVWNRAIYKGAKEGSDVVALQETLTLLDADRMVVGHTPHQRQISSYAQGKLIAIDIGMSIGMANSPPEALEILVDEKGVGSVTHAITADGSRRELRN